ncbi:MAG: hypothetical protein K9L59_10225 [Desulfobacterales bacterium]|nr:hypothetical protein [Desulfobacterales bacterium]
MNEYRKKLSVIPRQVRLTDKDLEYLRETVDAASVSAIAKKAALPYMLVYNIVHGRVKSMFAINYRKLFRREPPGEALLKVDGTYFRAMVDLYLYLMDDVTKADLFREFYPGPIPRRIDYRIFNGQIPSVEFRLVKIMEEKFAAQGLDPDTVRLWIVEHKSAGFADRVPYSAIRPALAYLQKELGIHPTFLLNQVVGRYETGDLKSVSGQRYEKVIELQKRAERLVDEGRSHELAALKESLYREKPGYTRFAEVEEALTFLQRYAGAGPKKYLGRSRKIYDEGGAKRIPDWQAERIWRDCEAFILQNPDLPLGVLPAASQKRRIASLLSVLVLCSTDLLYRDEGIVFEKQILQPKHHKSVYMTEAHGLTQVDMASSALGMKQKAFDLMVAMNCEIFKGIGKYTRRWYLPDQYLEEIRQKEPFGLIKAKYELLARTGKPPKQPDVCLN